MKLFIQAPAPSTLPPLYFGIPAFIFIYQALGLLLFIIYHSSFIIIFTIIIIIIKFYNDKYGDSEADYEISSNHTSLFFISYEFIPN